MMRRAVARWGWVCIIGMSGRPPIRGHESKDETALIDLGWIAEAGIFEEPGAGKFHAGICAGAVG